MTTADASAIPARGPGRPRDEDLAARVYAATRAELTEVADRGTIDITLAGIGRRAGVPKSTMYLRWPNLLDLFAEVLVEASDFGAPPDTGSLRTDLLALADQVVTASMVTPLLELHMQFFAMGARAPDQYRKFQENDMAIGVKRGRRVFTQARKRGEIGDDVDIDAATAAFMGALLMRALMSPTHRPPSKKAIQSIVNLFVDATV